MNKEWSDLNKQMQSKLKKSTFDEGIDTLLLLREKLYKEMLLLKDELAIEEFSLAPFLKANGYHSKTIAYSIWHIIRIEDIVVHSLISDDEEIFFSEKYKSKIGSPIITTGNELAGEEIVYFSNKLNIDMLYEYTNKVYESTNRLLKSLSYDDLRRKMTVEDRKRIEDLNVVSKEESANWLIDYWCNKDIKGLIKMPFSRHWIMHIEASLRIKKKILK